MAAPTRQNIFPLAGIGGGEGARANGDSRRTWQVGFGKWAALFGKWEQPSTSGVSHSLVFLLLLVLLLLL